MHCKFSPALLQGATAFEKSMCEEFEIKTNNITLLHLREGWLGREKLSEQMHRVTVYSLLCKIMK